MEFCVLFSRFLFPPLNIYNPSPPLLSLFCSAVKQVSVLVEEATRQSTYWKLPGDKSTPRDRAWGIVCFREKNDYVNVICDCEVLVV